MKTWKQWLEETKKPLSVQHHKCEVCGEDAVSQYFGIDAGGNDDWRTECSNPQCSSNRQGPQTLSQFV